MFRIFWAKVLGSFGYPTPPEGFRVIRAWQTPYPPHIAARVTAQTARWKRPVI